LRTVPSSALLPQLAHRASGRSAVDRQPVVTGLPGHLGELLEVERLDDVTVDAEPIRVRDVALLFRRGHDDDRYAPRTLVALQRACHLFAADARHLEVEQDQARVVALAVRILAATEDVVERLLAVLDPRDVIGHALILEAA